MSKYDELFAAEHALANPGHVVNVFVEQTDTLTAECSEPSCEWWNQLLL
jgi:hypothetical protein